MILILISNTKTAQTGGLSFLAGAERLFRSAPPSLSSLRDRRASARLSFGVERSSRVLITLPHSKTPKPPKRAACRFWQGQNDSNARHLVLETNALPTELYPYETETLIKHFCAQIKNFFHNPHIYYFCVFLLLIFFNLTSSKSKPLKLAL